MRLQKITAVTALGLFSLSLASANIAWAHDNDSQPGHFKTEVHQKIQEHHQSTVRVESVEDKVNHFKQSVASKAAELKVKTEDKKSQSGQKWDEAKHQLCAKRSNTIGKHGRNSLQVAANVENRITSISTKLQTFVTNKNLTVDNYQAKVDAINTKKAAVDAAIAAATASQKTFSCDSEDPKAQLDDFKAKMQTVRSALKDYRSAVKDLGGAIKTAWIATHPTTTPTSTPAEGV